MCKKPRSLATDNSGAVLVEFTLILPLLLILTFGIVEVGYIAYQQNLAQKATALGGRYLATRAPLVSGLSDCGVATTETAGTNCSAVAGSDSWSYSCSTASMASCDPIVFDAAVQQMKVIYPRVDSQNLEVTFSGTGLGYVGRGKPVPAITVKLDNIEYDYVVLDKLLGVSDRFGLDTAQTTIIAEDIGEGTGT